MLGSGINSDMQMMIVWRRPRKVLLSGAVMSMAGGNIIYCSIQYRQNTISASFLKSWNIKVLYNHICTIERQYLSVRFIRPP